MERYGGLVRLSGLPQACRAYSASEPGHCVRIGKWGLTKWELHGLIPILTFECIPRRDCREREISDRRSCGTANDDLRIEAGGNLRQRIHYLRGRLILAHLQQRVDLIIARVQLFANLTIAPGGYGCG